MPVAAVEALEAYGAATASCTRCRLAQGRTQVVFGAGNPQRRPDVRRRGARLPRGQAGRPVRRPGRQAAREAARRRRAAPRGRLHRERAEVPAAGQPRPAAGRDRGVRAAPLPADRADRAEGDRDARQLRDEAPLRPAARHHARARPGAGADDRRPQRPALSALPPGGGALHTGDAQGARGRLRPPAGAARCG